MSYSRYDNPEEGDPHAPTEAQVIDWMHRGMRIPAEWQWRVDLIGEARLGEEN